MDFTKYPSGAEWRKWDLHLHTPSSYDYKDKNITDDDIIDKLLNFRDSAGEEQKAHNMLKLYYK